MSNKTLKDLANTIVTGIENLRITEINHEILRTDKLMKSDGGLKRQKDFHTILNNFYAIVKELDADEMDSITAVKLEHVASKAGFYPLTNSERDFDFWMPYRENFVDMLNELANSETAVDFERIGIRFENCISNFQTHLDMSENVYQKKLEKRKGNVGEVIESPKPSISLTDFIAQVRGYSEKKVAAKKGITLFTQDVMDALNGMSPSPTKKILTSTVNLAEDFFEYMNETEFGSTLERNLEDSKMVFFLMRLDSIKAENKSVNLLICLERFNKFLQNYTVFEGVQNKTDETYNTVVADLNSFVALINATLQREFRKK